MALYVRVLRSIAVVLIVFYSIVNVVSLFGLDLETLLPGPPQRWGPDFNGYVMLPAVLYGFVALISMGLTSAGRRASEPATKAWIPVWALGAYFLTSAILYIVRFHSGGPEVRDGQLGIWYKADSIFTIVSPSEYHRAVAFEAEFGSSFFLMFLSAILLRSREWLRAIAEPGPASGSPV
jgi:hypothetical protein